MQDKLEKWRLILGEKSDKKGDVQLKTEESKAMDKTLAAVYDAERKGGLGSSSPNINRWLGDIRKYFPTEVVQVMQKDALERLDLTQMLLEPELLESVEPDLQLTATLLTLNKAMPDRTRETARIVVRKVVEKLEKKLKNPMREAIEGALRREVRNRRPKMNEIDWNKTIRANLKHYQPEYKTIIPENLYGYGRKGQALKHVILALDQSGSMATSVVYGAIFASIMSSLKTVKTSLVVFDTDVVDFTDQISDPVDLLFGTQLGGGTDINKALAYTENLVVSPSDTILVLITDLYEGGSERELIRRAATIKATGVQFITLLALNDEGAPSYDRRMAAQFATMDIPSFACTPDLFPELMAAVINKRSLQGFGSMPEV